MIRSESSKLCYQFFVPSVLLKGWIKLAILGFFIAPIVATPTLAFADFGAGASTSCSKGKKWCQKKGRCVNARCKRGRVWSASRCGCVRRSSEVMTDEDLYLEAVSVAKSGDYVEALALLRGIKNQDQTHVLTYIGYTTRKLGNLDEGIKYYHKALAINPKNTLAREYLGEGLLTKGDVAGAKVQLAAIEKQCGKTCHEYEDLAEEINKYEAKMN